MDFEREVPDHFSREAVESSPESTNYGGVLRGPALAVVLFGASSLVFAP